MLLTCHTVHFLLRYYLDSFTWQRSVRTAHPCCRATELVSEMTFMRRRNRAKSVPYSSKGGVSEKGVPRPLPAIPNTQDHSPARAWRHALNAISNQGHGSGAWLIQVQMGLSKYTLFFTKMLHACRKQRQITKEQQSLS